MRIVVTGATGFIGRTLVSSLVAGGHEVVAISRSPDAARSILEIDEAYSWDGLDDAFAQPVDAVVHLAGESVKGYWTKAKVKEVWDSRIRTTTALVAAIHAAADVPSVLISASGIGYYGDAGEVELKEQAPPGEDYFARLCVEWERLILATEMKGMRTVSLRFGIVLGADGGALPTMALPAKTGLSGPLGSGKQWWSWVSQGDAVAAIEHVLHTPELEGAVNVVTPDPIRQVDFQRSLCAALNRPSFLPAPAFGVRLILGKFADEVLSSKRVIPAALSSTGFRWADDDLDGLFQRIFGR